MRSMGALTEDEEALDAALRTAIIERRLVAFELVGYYRIAEPHDYGVADGKTRLLFYQVGGLSSSGKPFGWRSVSTARLAHFRVLPDRFPGTRRPPTPRRTRWESIIASVSMAPGPLATCE